MIPLLKKKKKVYHLISENKFSIILFRNQIFEKHSLKYLHRNELDKACSIHDAVYSDCKDLAKRTVSDKILKDFIFVIWIY